MEVQFWDLGLGLVLRTGSLPWSLLSLWRGGWGCQPLERPGVTKTRLRDRMQYYCTGCRFTRHRDPGEIFASLLMQLHHCHQSCISDNRWRHLREVTVSVTPCFLVWSKVLQGCYSEFVCASVCSPPWLSDRSWLASVFIITLPPPLD